MIESFVKVSYIYQEENNNTLINKTGSTKVLEPLEVLENSSAKDSKAIQKNCEEPSIPNYIYRVGRTDIWGCKNCKFKDYIWFMMKHPCKNNNN